MLTVSAEFLQALKNKATQDIRLEFTDGTIIDKNSISITSGGLTYTEILNGDTDMTMGRAVMTEVNAALVNHDGRFADFDFTQEFTAKFGAEVDGTFVYTPLGVFRGERPEKVRGRLIDFTAHDKMSLFDKSAEAFTDSLTFPITLGGIFTRLCDFCGIGYVSAEFINSGKIFNANPLEGTEYTCREILAYIAEAACAYARISRDGAVELVWFSAADYTVTRTDRFEISESEFEAPPIDRLEVYNSYGDQLNTSGTGDIVYGITDNPFLYIENDTQVEELQPYVDAIYARLVTFPAYHPSSFRAEFNPAVQCGDIITVVDDYDETISFPVFMQTITWTGYAKVTYENTGGMTRQNAPIEQRELEQIKKRMLRSADLSTAIDSYLNSQEGVASITQAVSGTFVTSDELREYVTESQLDARIESYINGEEGIASITESLSGTFVLEDELGDYATKTEVTTSITQKISEFEASLTLSASSSSENSVTVTDEEVGDFVIYEFDDAAGYAFERTSDGYYTSQNAGIDDSFSYAEIDFNFTEDTLVAIRCISYGESNYDYGLVSNVDYGLATSSTADSSSTYVFHSFKGESSADPVDLFMTIPAGNHFITLKYVKDSSQSSNGDYFKFRVLKTKQTSSSQKSTLTLKAGSTVLSSADITFSGFVTFESLETAGATTINGANVTTDNLTVENVFLGGENSRKILTSNLGSSGGTVDIGFIENYGSSSYGKVVRIYADHLYIIPPGGDELDDDVLVISTKDMHFGANSSDWTFDI